MLITRDTVVVVVVWGVCSRAISLTRSWTGWPEELCDPGLEVQRGPQPEGPLASRRPPSPRLCSPRIPGRQTWAETATARRQESKNISRKGVKMKATPLTSCSSNSASSESRREEIVIQTERPKTQFLHLILGWSSWRITRRLEDWGKPKPRSLFRRENSTVECFFIFIEGFLEAPPPKKQQKLQFSVKIVL